MILSTSDGSKKINQNHSLPPRAAEARLAARSADEKSGRRAHTPGSDPVLRGRAGLGSGMDMNDTV